MPKPLVPIMMTPVPVEVLFKIKVLPLQFRCPTCNTVLEQGMYFIAAENTTTKTVLLCAKVTTCCNKETQVPKLFNSNEEIHSFLDTIGKEVAERKLQIDKGKKWQELPKPSFTQVPPEAIGRSSQTLKEFLKALRAKTKSN